MRRALPFLLCSSLVLFAPSAWADSASALKAQGDAAFNARKYSDAIVAYDKAYAEGHDAAVLYNKARSHEALEQFPEALAALERFDREAPPAMRAKVTGLSVLIADIRAHVATLVLTCNVPGAQVTVREQRVGETSSSALRVQVNRGPARLVVTKEGYAPFTQDLDLRGDASVMVTVKLETKSAGALVKITSSPPQAQVSIDGRAVGSTPVELTLSPKSYSVVLDRDGYEKLTTSIVVDSEKPRTVDLQLAPSSSSVATKWWFWTAIGGAVLVAGGIVAIVAVQEKEAAPGSLGTVSAPLLVWGR